MFSFPFLISVTIFSILSTCIFSSSKLREKLIESPPEWMKEQISKDLLPFKDTGITQESLDAAFDHFKNDQLTLKCTIKNHQVKFTITSDELTLLEYNNSLGPGYCERFLTIKHCIHSLAKKKHLTCSLFYLCMMG